MMMGTLFPTVQQTVTVFSPGPSSNETYATRDQMNNKTRRVESRGRGATWVRWSLPAAPGEVVRVYGLPERTITPSSSKKDKQHHISGSIITYLLHRNSESEA